MVQVLALHFVYKHDKMAWWRAILDVWIWNDCDNQEDVTFKMKWFIIIATFCSISW